MKTKLTALALITVTALSLAPKPAAASDKGLAIVGGFLGGLIVASAINDSHYDAYNHRTVIVADRNDYCDEGYWRDVTVEVWVPGCWIVERNRHGHSYRRYIGGHNEYRTNRVWVDGNRRDRHDGRGYRSGRGRR